MRWKQRALMLEETLVTIKDICETPIDADKSIDCAEMIMALVDATLNKIRTDTADADGD